MEEEGYMSYGGVSLKVTWPRIPYMIPEEKEDFLKFHAFAASRLDLKNLAGQYELVFFNPSPTGSQYMARTMPRRRHAHFTAAQNPDIFNIVTGIEPMLAIPRMLVAAGELYGMKMIMNGDVSVKTREHERGKDSILYKGKPYEGEPGSVPPWITAGSDFALEVFHDYWEIMPKDMLNDRLWINATGLSIDVQQDMDIESVMNCRDAFSTLQESGALIMDILSRCTDKVLADRVGRLVDGSMPPELVDKLEAAAAQGPGFNIIPIDPRTSNEDISKILAEAIEKAAASAENEPPAQKKRTSH